MSIFRIPKRIYKKARKYFTKNTIVFFASVGVILSAVFLLWVSSWQLPTLESFEQRKVAESTKIFDRTGEVLLYDVYQNIKRTVVPFENISQNVKDGVLAIEDTNFYNHNGVEPLSFLRAALVNIFSLEFSQGGSTITQQAVKNSLLSGEKKISRKLKEWVLAIKLEKILTKEQIFAMYLNEIPFGGTLYGVEEASQAFFDKPAKDVTIAEAAYLAAIPKAPTFYSPYGKNRERLEERKNLVLRKMLENGFITEEELNSAKNEKVEFKPRAETGIKAPHFVLYVIEELKKKYGEEVLEEGGLRVFTTLNYELQEKAEELAKEYGHENEVSSNAENVALVAIDPNNGDILSMVGSRDYFDEEIDGNFNVATGERQPGSSFKPFVYAQAFKKGYTPNTIVFDLPTEFSTRCTPQGTPKSPGAECYKPENYDLTYRGPITMRNALAQSINVPAIQTFYLAGMNDSLRLAKDMGISTLTDINQYGLTLVLGGGEVTLLDMTSAYGVFANDGVRHPYHGILEIKDKGGKTIEKHNDLSIEVLDKNIALQISDILSDEAARIPAFGANSPLNFPGRDVAVKTGTTNDYRDAWIIGYTKDIVIGAWAGNNDNSPMQKKVARYLIAPYWNLVMGEALKTLPNEQFEQPVIDNSYDLKPILRGGWQGGLSVLMDKSTGKRATEFTPPELVEERVIGEVHSILYWVDKDNPRGPVPENPQNDPQFELWEYPVRLWVARNNVNETDERDIPEDFDDNHGPEFEPDVRITEPDSNEDFDPDEKITVRLDVDAEFPLSRADYFVNGDLIGSTDNTPFVFSFIPEDVAGIKKKNTLRVVVYDSVFNRGDDQQSFDVDL